MWNFLDQGSKLLHSSNLRHSSNNTGSLTHWATRELQDTLFFFVFFPFFLGLHPWHMEVPRLGVESELLLPAYAIATAVPDPAASANYTTAPGNAGSLTHWGRPGIEHATSWFLVRFTSAAPDRNSKMHCLFQLHFIIIRRLPWLYLVFFFIICFLFLGPQLWHMEDPRLGVHLELQLPACPQPQQHQIRAPFATYAATFGNTASLTFWIRPGIEPASSWIVVRFLTCWATVGTPINGIFWWTWSFVVNKVTNFRLFHLWLLFIVGFLKKLFTSLIFSYIVLFQYFKRLLFFLFGLFAFSRVAPMAYGGSQARDLIGAVATSLRQSHSNSGSESCLRPTPQLTATLDP